MKIVKIVREKGENLGEYPKDLTWREKISSRAFTAKYDNSSLFPGVKEEL